MSLIFDRVRNAQIYFNRKRCFILTIILFLSFGINAQSGVRERISINAGWMFMRYTSQPGNLIYDERPQVIDRNDNVVADTKPTEAIMRFGSPACSWSGVVSKKNRPVTIKITAISPGLKSSMVEKGVNKIRKHKYENK